MKYVGMFINLSQSDLDKKEVECRLKAFWDDGVKKAYHGDVELLPLVYGAGIYHTYPNKANKLIRSSPSLKDTVFFTPCGPSMWHLQIATQNKVPIVFGGVVDPFATGVFTDNYYCTGYTSYTLDRASRLVDVINGYGVKLAAILYDPQMRVGVGQLGAILTRMQQYGIKPELISIRQDMDAVITPRIDYVASQPHGGLLVLTSTLTATLRDKIIAIANKPRPNPFPAIYPNCLYVRSKGYMSYGPPTIELYRKAGLCAGGILNNPNLGPIQTNDDFSYCCSRETATKLGLKIPTSAELGGAAIEVID